MGTFTDIRPVFRSFLLLMEVTGVQNYCLVNYDTLIFVLIRILPGSTRVVDPLIVDSGSDASHDTLGLCLPPDVTIVVLSVLSSVFNCSE